MKRTDLITLLKQTLVIEQLEETGKINIDFLNCSLDLLIEVLENEFAINTDIEEVSNGMYLVNLDYERMV